jgi:hypothetical protein
MSRAFQASGSSPSLFTLSRAMSHMAFGDLLTQQPKSYSGKLLRTYFDGIYLLLLEIAKLDPPPHILHDEMSASTVDEYPAFRSA